MALSLTLTEAIGRMIESARSLAGMNQSELGREAKVSASTVSNVERGADVQPDTIHALRAALKGKGVTMTFDRINKTILLACSFEEPYDDDD